jgi:phosphoglycerate dehydrogenase-like enzyme|tara:strand:+ start:845 stop:1768 length:924 start_codon:yes stop_codon:yes gene_type:complete
MKILITEFMESSSVEILKKSFDITFDQDLSKNHIKLKDSIGKFDALIVRNKTQVNQEILKNAISLKFIGRLGVGLDNIDTEYCKNNNIHVQPATGMNADSVAEFVINSSLSLLKNNPLMHQETLLGNWPRTSILSRELKGKTLGLLGFGLIAKKVSLLASVFNAKIIAHDPFVGQNIGDEFNTQLVSTNELFEFADIISIHLPLTQSTKNLMNYKAFKHMLKRPIIINSSRGSIINEKDLLRAYDEKLISGFALDVYEKEPVPKDFLIAIKKDTNCILTPHIAGVTEESNSRVSEYIVNAVLEFFKL